MDNKIINVSSNETNDNISLSNSNLYYNQNFYTNNFYDEKSYNRFVKNIETIIRSSEEYSKYLGYLKNEVGLDHCMILSNIKEDYATIEFHHHPFTLYDIVSIVINKFSILNLNISSFAIAKEVLDLHFKNKVGLIPLSKTVHQLYHADKIELNLNFVFGYFNKFVDEYFDYIPDELKEKYNKLIEFSKNNSSPSYPILNYENITDGKQQ